MESFRINESEHYESESISINFNWDDGMSIIE